MLPQGVLVWSVATWPSQLISVVVIMYNYALQILHKYIFHDLYVTTNRDVPHK